jgi:hypothetical protein
MRPDHRHGAAGSRAGSAGGTQIIQICVRTMQRFTSGYSHLTAAACAITAASGRNAVCPLLQNASVLIADSAPLSAVEWAAVTKRRSASSGLLPRDQMRAWVSAAKAVGCVPVGVLGWTG